jgi:hypothetical protein
MDWCVQKRTHPTAGAQFIEGITMNEDLPKLVKYLEENLRASTNSGIEFIDPKSLKIQLDSRQNHIVFGRRGAGKSTLLFALRDNLKIIPIFINLEDYKDITFPNIIIQILCDCFVNLENEISSKYPWYRTNINIIRFQKELRDKQRKLKEILNKPDSEQLLVKTKEGQEDKLTGTLKTTIPYLTNQTSGQIKSYSEQEVSRNIPFIKIDELKKEIGCLKKIFNKANSLSKKSGIYLILDDFYFIPRIIQPELIDYFHRLTKDTELFLKVATIKHRTTQFLRTSQTYIGVELGHDAFSIDMDYTLDKFEDLQAFMLNLLKSANESSGANIPIEELFGGEGFTQLCLASGGVPRDFLSLFVSLCNSIVLSQNRAIGKVDVNEAAIANIGNKLTSMKIDAGDEAEALENFLQLIRKQVYEIERKNVFLIAKPDLDNFPQFKQRIRELVDLRLIHLIEDNTSCAPSDGRRYEAYMLDVGLYSNSRPRGFEQIQPGASDSKSRKDRIRSAPRINLADIEKDFQSKFPAI